MNKIRVGLIGCGGNMRGHIRRLTAIPEAEIVAIVEPAPANVQTAREQYSQLAAVPMFDTHAAMLAAVRPDAVEISTPHTLHAQQILDSLDAGCHVLCEKPMTCTTAEAKAVVERAEQTSKTVMVSY